MGDCLMFAISTLKNCNPKAIKSWFPLSTDYCWTDGSRNKTVYVWKCRELKHNENVRETRKWRESLCFMLCYTYTLLKRCRAIGPIHNFHKHIFNKADKLEFSDLFYSHSRLRTNLQEAGCLNIRITKTRRRNVLDKQIIREQMICNEARNSAISGLKKTPAFSLLEFASIANYDALNEF